MSTLTMSRAPTRSLGAVARRPTPPPVRLTRRGRLIVLVALLVAVLAALVAWGPSVVATSEPGTPVPARTVVVQPGETLWDIATRANPSGNIGEQVHEIAELNGLPSTGELQIGQRIAVPID